MLETGSICVDQGRRGWSLMLAVVGGGVVGGGLMQKTESPDFIFPKAGI